jgi:hypothetical protein
MQQSASATPDCGPVPGNRQMRTGPLAIGHLPGIALVWAISSIAVPTASAYVITSEAEFVNAVLAPTTVSFNLFSVGFLPQTTLQLGSVVVQLTSAGSAPIFGPGAFGFSTNYLSTGVQDGNNNVVITLPAGTQAAGLKIASVYPVSVTASWASASETVPFSASQVSFLGFAESPGLRGLQRITISSPFVPLQFPIVNVGDITYASALAGSGVSTGPAVPTLSNYAILLLAFALMIAGFRFRPSRKRERQTRG